MNVTGMLYGSRLLAHVDFPTSEVLGPDARAGGSMTSSGPTAAVSATPYLIVWVLTLNFVAAH